MDAGSIPAASTSYPTRAEAFRLLFSPGNATHVGGNMRAGCCWSAIAAVLLAACAGTPFSWEDTARIQNGMTEADVVTILGNPRTRAQSGNVVILTWAFGTPAGAKAVAYRLVDGRVTNAASTVSGVFQQPPGGVLSEPPVEYKSEEYESMLNKAVEDARQAPSR